MDVSLVFVGNNHFWNGLNDNFAIEKSKTYNFLKIKFPNKNVFGLVVQDACTLCIMYPLNTLVRQSPRKGLVKSK